MTKRAENQFSWNKDADNMEVTCTEISTGRNFTVTPDEVSEENTAQLWCLSVSQFFSTRTSQTDRDEKWEVMTGKLLPLLASKFFNLDRKPSIKTLAIDVEAVARIQSERKGKYVSPASVQVAKRTKYTVAQWNNFCQHPDVVAMIAAINEGTAALEADDLDLDYLADPIVAR